MKALLSIGALRSIEIITPAGKRTLRFSNRWLTWDQKKRNFLICRVTGKSNARMPASIRRQHKRFHDAPDNGQSLRGDCPTPKGNLTEVGLVKALVYDVPKLINSPEKNHYQWHHSFGDTGHKGGNYHPKVMPMLLKDSNGNFFFKRLPGNIYKVDNWLRG